MFSGLLSTDVSPGGRGVAGYTGTAHVPSSNKHGNINHKNMQINFKNI